MITIDKSIINDLPIGNLDDHLFRRAIQMLVIADENGILPEKKDLPFLLRTNDKDIDKTINELFNYGFLKKYNGFIEEYFGQKNEKIQIIGFQKYVTSVTEERDESSQEPSRKLSDAERSKRYREKQKASRKENENKLNNINNNIKNNNLKENKLFEFSKENSNVEIYTNSEKSDESSRDANEESSQIMGPEKFSWAKEEELRAYEFWLASDILPTKNEYGRWIKELRQFTEAGISIPAMRAAIAEMKTKHLHIGAPGSVFKIARSISTQDAIEAPMTNEEIVDLLDYSELGDI